MDHLQKYKMQKMQLTKAEHCARNKLLFGYR